MKYKVYASLKEDINEGSCWVSQPQLPSRSVVRITNQASKKSVYCEALYMDGNFIELYNDRAHTHKIALAQDGNVIVLNEWYRTRLGNLSTQSEQELNIERCESKWAKFRACIQHPQIVIRLATWLAVLSVLLGLVGFLLGVVSIAKGAT